MKMLSIINQKGLFSAIFGLLLAVNLPTFGQGYKRLWQEVTLYQRQGLPLSAAKVAQKIQQKAIQNQNKQQEMAAFLVQATLQQAVNPDSFYSNFKLMQQRIRQSRHGVDRMVYAAFAAEVCRQNQHRGQWLTLPRQDSLPIEYWSRDDYRRQAIYYWKLSLCQPERLRLTRMKQYAPLFQPGTADRFLGDDLLQVLGRNALQGMRQMNAEPQEVDRMAHRILEVYRRAEQPEGELFFMVDSIEHAPGNNWDETVEQRLEAFEMLARRFAKLPAVLDVYLKASRLTAAVNEKVRLLKKGLKLHPNSKLSEPLRQELASLRQPYWDWQLPASAASGDSLQAVAHYRNISKVEARVYRLAQCWNDSVQRLPLNEVRSLLDKHATLIRKDCLTLQPASSAYETQCDTLSWAVPQPGYYTVLFTVRSEQGIRHERLGFHSSALRLLALSVPGTAQTEAVVVHALTGSPQPNVRLEICSNDSRNKQQWGYAATTDPSGRARFDLPPGNSYVLRAVCPGDTAQTLVLYRPEATRWTHSAVWENSYTDRALYRPGQQVHLCGVVARMKDFAYRVCADSVLPLSLYDATGREVVKDSVRTDEWGNWQYTYKLPEEGTLGRFRVTTGQAVCTFSVEEYARPHFELLLDRPLPSVLAWGDTLKLAGWVRQYNGSPAAHARVTFAVAADCNDTLYADAHGRFEWKYPIGDRPKHKNQYSYHGVQIRCTALHPSGEQSEQHVFVRVVTLKNTLSVRSDFIWNKHLAPEVNFVLTNSRGEPVPATVFYRLYNKVKGQTAKTPLLSGKYIANRPFDFQGGNSLPSGRYVLQALAALGQDTLTAATEVLLYAPEDRKVPVDTTFWCRLMQPDFTEQQPFVCEIGSSEKNVSLYYTLCADGHIVDQRRIAFDDSLFTLTVPYRKEYEKGASLHLAFVKHNQTYLRDFRIERRAEKNQLKYKWHTFRDKLLPGTHETWQLQVTDSAGKPVDATGMFTLYDASLDAILQHHWELSVPRPSGYRLPYWRTPYVGHVGAWVFFPLKQKSEAAEAWSDLNKKLLGEDDETRLLSLPEFSVVRRKSMTRMLAGKMTGAENNTIQSDRATEEEAVEELADASPAAGQAAEPGNHHAVRTNLQETAFFRTAVRTDKQGMMRLDFEMPQALTRWHLQGLVYTREMNSVRIDTLVVTRQMLMAQLFVPPYLHQYDCARIPVTLTNLANQEDRGKVTLEITDAETNDVVFRQEQTFRIDGNASEKKVFTFKPKQDNRKLLCRVLAEGQCHADGEQRELRVLPATVSLTYAHPFVLNKPGQYQQPFAAPSAYAENGKMPAACLLEYHSNPLFAALQVLPVLQNSLGRNAEEVAAAYYATVVSAELLSKQPAAASWTKQWNDPNYIRKEEEWWKWTNRQNARLWTTTPWQEQYAAAGERFNHLYKVQENPHLQEEQQRKLLDNLLQLQHVDGSFGWMPGMRGHVGVTQRVLSLMQTLRSAYRHGKTSELSRLEDILVNRAFDYIYKVYQTQWAHEPLSDKTPDYSQLEFIGLAASVMGKEEALKQKMLNNKVKVLRQHSSDMPFLQKISVAKVLHAYGYDEDAKKCLLSVKQHLVTDSLGACSFELQKHTVRSTEQHLLLHLDALNLFRVLYPESKEPASGMWHWLLLQKRTQGWDNNYLSACAVNTLLQDTTLVAGKATDTLKLGSKSQVRVLPEAQPGLPVVRFVQPFQKENIFPNRLFVDKQTQTPTWGTTYLQYEVRPEEMQAEKKEWGELSVKLNRMPDSLKVGEEWNTAFLIRADRDYDFMFLRIHAAAGCTPLWQNSGYRNMQGVGYYLSLEEESMLLYFDHLPKGNYVLEIPYKVQFGGTYVHGGAEFQSYYAPEFRTYMPGKRIYIDEN